MRNSKKMFHITQQNGNKPHLYNMFMYHINYDIQTIYIVILGRTKYPNSEEITCQSLKRKGRKNWKNSNTQLQKPRTNLKLRFCFTVLG